MRIDSLAEIEPAFIERAHRMVWCDLATVGADGRPRTRVVHPVGRCRRSGGHPDLDGIAGAFDLP